MRANPDDAPENSVTEDLCGLREVVWVRGELKYNIVVAEYLSLTFGLFHIGVCLEIPKFAETEPHNVILINVRNENE